MEPRLDWIDYSKGIGIILVVYGHVLRGVYNANLGLSEFFFNLSDTLIYGFHMPLFFFLSGFFFTKCFTKRGPAPFLADKAKALLYPYVLWMLFQSTMELLLSAYTNNHLSLFDLLLMLYSPRAQFWFLHTLFLMYGFTTALFMVSRKYGAFFALGVSIPLIFFPHALDLAILGPFATNYAYFALGIVCFRFGLDRLQFPMTARSLLTAGATFGVTAYLAMQENTAALPLTRLALAVAGTFLVLMIATRSAGAHKPTVLKHIGQRTMPIYLAHIIAGSGIRIILDKQFHFQGVFTHVVIGTLAGILLPLLVYNFAKSKGLAFVFEYPGRKNKVKSKESELLATYPALVNG